MEQKNYKNKFSFIQQSLEAGAYDVVIKESATLFEVAMKQIFHQAITKLPFSDRKELNKAEEEIGKGSKGVDDFTFGQLVGLYRQSKLFKKWENYSDVDLGILTSLDLNSIVEMRNKLMHQDGDCSKFEAELVLNYLKNFFASLGVADIEEAVSKVFVPSKEENINNTNNTINEEDIEISRYKNTYDVTDSKEQLRISLQRNLTLMEDCNVISKLILDKDSLNILDIGCNNGDNIISRLDNMNVLDKITNLIGIDINSEIVSDANKKYANSHFNFFDLDVESNHFIQTLSDIMKEKEILKFDLITIPMVLMHLKKPYKLLKNIRKFLASSGSIFIRDMDDGLCLAYPDDDNLVTKMMKISSSIATTGFRENGREIYSLLKKSGFKNIRLHPESINTMHRSHDDRDALFQINFDFIIGDLKIAIDKDPNDEKLVNDYKWIVEAYEDLEELFQRDDFFYQMGTVVYTITNE